MEYLGIMGFAMAGFILPELLKVLGSNNLLIPWLVNFLSTLSAGFISASFLI